MRKKGIVVHKIMIAMLTIALLAQPVWGAETHPHNANSGGVKHLDPYQIYPKGRLGNALYKNRHLLFSFPDRKILDAQQISEQDILVYLYEDPLQNSLLGVHDETGANSIEIKHVDNEFYELWIPNLGVRKIYRIKNNTIIGIYNKVRTATGVAPGKDFAAFYHIYAAGPKEVDGVTDRYYTFRIHILHRESDQIETLPLLVDDKLPSLRLVWSDDQTLSYRLADRTVHNIDVTQYLPQYFEADQ